MVDETCKQCDNCVEPLDCVVQPERCPTPLTDGVYENARVVVQNGCITDITPGVLPAYIPAPCSGGGGGGGLTSVSVTQSQSVQLAGNGTTGSPLQANLRLSATAGNTATVNADGLYVPSSGGGGGGGSIYVLSSTTVQLDGDGTQAAPLTADVKVSPDVNNQLQDLSNGLYVPPVTVGLSSAAAQMTTLDGSGKLLTQLIHQSPEAVSNESPIVTSGSGNTGSKLQARLALSGDNWNGLESRAVLSQAGALLGYALYGREETTKVTYTNLATNKGAAIISDLANGWTVLIGDCDFPNSGGRTPPPIMTVATSGSEGGGGTVQSTGTVNNITNFARTAPNVLPAAYEWYTVIAQSKSTYMWVTSADVSGTSIRVAGYREQNTQQWDFNIVAFGRALNHE